jgi:hypothetical protein
MTAWLTRVACLIVLLFVVPSLAGCPGTSPGEIAGVRIDSDHWVRAWCDLRFSPLVADSLYVPWIDYSGNTVRRDPGPMRFERAQRYGRYVVLDVINRALLLDGERPVWGGEAVLPVRSGNEVYGLYLLSDRPSMVENDGLRDVTYLSLSPDAVADVSWLGLAYVPPHRPGDWVVDIDGDGNDEFILVEPLEVRADGSIGPCTILDVESFRWAVRVYERGAAKRHPNPSICVLNVPLPRDCIPELLAVERKDGGSVALAWKTSPREAFGTISRDPNSGKFRFVAAQ